MESSPHLSLASGPTKGKRLVELQKERERGTGEHGGLKACKSTKR